MATKASGVILDIRGRDVESAELAIEFNKDTCRWRVLGKAAEVHISEQRAKIIATLRDAGEPMKITALAAATGMKRNPLEVLLGRMAKEGEIQRVGKGLYAHKDCVPAASQAAAGKGKHGGQSVASVSVSTMPTDRETDPQSVEHVENNQQNTGICPSVASVGGNADAGLGSGIENAKPASVPAQTDRTDRQIGAQAAGQPLGFAALNLSGDLSRAERQTDARLNAGDCWQELDIPPFLRREPFGLAAVDADGDGRPVVALTEATAEIESRTGTVTRRHNKPVLGPVGDSLDDLA